MLMSFFENIEKNNKNENKKNYINFSNNNSNDDKSNEIKKAINDIGNILNCLVDPKLGEPNKPKYRIIPFPLMLGCPIFKLRHEISECCLKIQRFLWDLSMACPEAKGPLTLSKFQENMKNNLYLRKSRYIEDIISQLLENIERLTLLKKELSVFIEEKYKNSKPLNGFSLYQYLFKSPDLFILKNQKGLFDEVEIELKKEFDFQLKYPSLPKLLESFDEENIKSYLEEVSLVKKRFAKMEMNTRNFKNLKNFLLNLKSHNIDRQNQLEIFQKNSQIINEQKTIPRPLEYWQKKWKKWMNSFEKKDSFQFKFTKDQIKLVHIQIELFNKVLSFLKKELEIQNEYEKLSLISDELTKNYIFSQLNNFKSQLKNLLSQRSSPNTVALEENQAFSLLQNFTYFESYLSFRQEQLKNYLHFYNKV